MDTASFIALDEVVRPWRRRTLVVSCIAAVELLALAGGGIYVLRHRAQDEPAPAAKAAPAAAPARAPARARRSAPAHAVLPRSATSVIVLNGNGVAGAAGGAAERVRREGYVVGAVGNAPRRVLATTIMYRPGYREEGLRLGRDLGIRRVAPLDGLRPGDLLGAHVALILGSR